jgi:hypothetical protein
MEKGIHNVILAYGTLQFRIAPASSGAVNPIILKAKSPSIRRRIIIPPA